MQIHEYINQTGNPDDAGIRSITVDAVSTIIRYRPVSAISREGDGYTVDLQDVFSRAGIGIFTSGGIQQHDDEQTICIGSDSLNRALLSIMAHTAECKPIPAWELQFLANVAFRELSLVKGEWCDNDFAEPIVFKREPTQQ